MRDEGANETRVACDEIQADCSAAAVSVDVRRLFADGRKERCGIVCVHRDRDVLRFAVERATSGPFGRS
jgi:hypothetical protein